MKLIIPCLILALGTLSGCGSGDEGPVLEPIQGIVTLKNKALANADVSFRPKGDTPGIGGQARTDAEGKFTVVYGRGGEGLPVGTYKVSVSRRLMPDNSPVPADDTTEPMDSPARETLPQYADIEKSPIEVTIEKGKPVEIKL